MRIFLTGATGYLGGVLARRLAAGGHQVIALARPGRDVQSLVQAGVTPFTGDITDRASMREGMSGADWVVHAAALVDLDAPREAMERANVLGSENVASLAYKLGVGRFLSVSSIAYFGGSPADGSPGTEESPVLRPFPSLYSETKHQGQERIRQWARQGLAANTVYPALIYGPPGKRQGSNIALRALAKGRFPVLMGGDRRTSWVHVDDVVDALVRIVERAEPGRDYVLAGDTISLRDLATRGLPAGQDQAAALRGAAGSGAGRRGRRLPLGAARRPAAADLPGPAQEPGPPLVLRRLPRPPSSSPGRPGRSPRGCRRRSSSCSS